MKVTTRDILLIGGGLIAFSAIKRLLIAGGLAAGPGTQAASQLIIDPSSYFKPAYYKRVGGRLVTRAKAEQLSRQIHGSFTIFQDDFNRYYGCF
jgi:hypothetical protein